MSSTILRLLFIKCFFRLIHTEFQELKPLWINNTLQAEKSGVDLRRIAREYCTSQKTPPEVEFLSAANVEPIFGLEIAEDLLREHSFVALNFKELCKEIQLAHPVSKFSENSQNELETVLLASETKKDTVFGSEVALLTPDEDLDVTKLQEKLSKELGQKVEMDKPVEVEKKKEDKKGSKDEKTVQVPIGIDVESFDSKSINSLEKALRGENDTELDEILTRYASEFTCKLAHGLKAPILITEESFLKRIWRPDAFLLYLKPKSQLVLCKYPHDSQVIYLKISSIAFPNNIVRFSWFSKKEDAININKNVQLPELYIDGVDKGTCASRRKTGNFTCIEARFYMKRNIGFYFAQTYVPTATCVLFSWISVWLPEEFVEGRVFVALTVFLTLSAAIDIWFGFTATFVFCTMFQALVVIMLEHLSKLKKKIVEDQNESLSVHKVTRLLLDSKRYHNWARGLDDFFKVMYPVIFIIFLFVYVFVIIEGDENKCLRGNQMGHSVSSSEL